MKGGWRIIIRNQIDDIDRRRSRMDVISSILEAANGGCKKTRIMYRASLNFKQMQRYVPLLIKKGLLEDIKTDRGTFYKTTRKGLDYLKKYEELREHIHGSRRG